MPGQPQAEQIGLVLLAVLGGIAVIAAAMLILSLREWIRDALIRRRGRKRSPYQDVSK